MYRVIAYHGKGKEQEVQSDLRLLWDGLRKLATCRNLSHVYCFQTVNSKDSPSPHWGEGWGEGEELSADLFIIVQYGDDVATKLALRGKPKLASQIRSHVDYWLYVRENRI